MTDIPTLIDSRWFRVDGGETGDVTDDTVFNVHQQDSTVWVDYYGGDVVRGFMIGERTNEGIAMQYIHRTRAGATVEGSCDWHVNVSDEGVRVSEIWHRSDGKTGAAALSECSAPS